MTRRHFAGLAAGAVAAPFASGTGTAQSVREVDVVVIGAGAAGIAAARSLVRSGVSVLIVEASRRTGGRCLTDTITFPAPFDRGAHWLHGGEVNPLTRLGRTLGFDIYADPGLGRMMADTQPLGDVDFAAYEGAVRGAEDAIIRFGEGRAEDVAAAAGLPRDLGEWRGPVRFRLGPLDCGKTLSEISAHDFARATAGDDFFCRPGFGTLIATLGRGLPTAFNNPVSAITVEGDAVTIQTANGTLRARAAIVTVSTAVLARDAIRFTPTLSDTHRAAVEGLRLGSYMHVGLELPGNPVGVDPDTTIYLKSDEERTFAALARAGGNDLWYVDTGGIYARELEAAGSDAAVAYATDWLVAAFGSGIRSRVKQGMATSWGLDPFIGGAWSVASPGRAGARADLRQPHAERVLFAGEACHDTLWGTVAGAWETGRQAAAAAVRIVRG